MLAQNQTQEEVVSFISVGLCVGFGPFYKGCHEYVLANAPRILEFLVNNTDSQKICQATIFCPNALKQQEQPKKEVIAKVKNAGCDLCTKVLNVTKNLLSQNLTDQEIINYVSFSVCIYFGPFYKGCHQYIQEHGVEFLEKLSNNIQPAEICNATIFCPDVSKPTELVEAKPTFDKCSFCSEVLNQTKALLAQNVTDQEIVDYLSVGLCVYFGPFYKVCHQFVQEKGAAYLEQLSQDIDPQTICSEIGLCGSNKFGLLKAFLKRNN